MTVKCVLMRDGNEIPISIDPDDKARATVAMDCPSCRNPLRVIGGGRTIGGHDYYRASGFCAACREPVGEIRAYVSTIFGLEEDHAVLEGRPRVY